MYIRIAYYTCIHSCGSWGGRCIYVYVCIYIYILYLYIHMIHVSIGTDPGEAGSPATQAGGGETACG